MKIHWVVLIIIFSMVISHHVHGQSSNPRIKVYGYLTAWALKMNTPSSNYENCLYTDIDWDACTDYIIFNTSFDNAGGMAMADDWYYGDKTSWGEPYLSVPKRRLLNDYIHLKGKSIQLCFFIGSDDQLFTTTSGRAAMIKTVVDSVIGSKYQHDGVYWDIELFSLVDSVKVKSFLA